MDFDLFVIGGGSGGVRAARVAARQGVRVGLAEENRIGGTCVLKGRIPKKLLVYASRYAEDFKDACGYGWHVTAPFFDWTHFVEAKNKELRRLKPCIVGGWKRQVSAFLWKEHRLMVHSLCACLLVEIGRAHV